MRGHGRALRAAQRAGLACVVLVAAGLLPAVTWAQMELAVLVGTVKDESGAPLADVTFRIKDLERGREVVVKSDKGGKFYRRGLPAVEYDLTVEKEGYQPIHDRIKLSAGTDRRYDFKLAKATPAGAAEFVEGVEAFNRGDTAAAVKAFEAAVEKAPALPELRVNLALGYIRAKRLPEAVAQLEKAASLAPDDPRVAFQLGGAYIDMNEMDKAAQAFEHGLSKAATPPDAVTVEAMVALGDVYFAKGEADKAVARYQGALAAKPDSAGAKLGLGKVHASRNELDQALALFREVAAGAPGSAEATRAEAFIKALGATAPPPQP